jgi:hypothetical protein
MSNIPLPALSIQPPQQPDLLGQVAKVRQIQAMGQEQQLRQQKVQSNALDIQQQERDARDSQAMTAAMQEWDGKNPDELPGLLIKNKASAKAVFGMKSSILEQKKTYAQIAKDDAETGKNTMQALGEKHDMLAGAVRNVLTLPDDQLAAGAQQTLQEAVGNKLLSPEEAQQYGQLAQLPPAQLRSQLTFMEKHFMGDKAQREAVTQQEAARHNKAMEKQQADALDNNVSEAKLAFRAAQGDKDAEAALKRLDASKRASRPVNNIMTSTDAKDIADAIENGDQPPTLQGLYRNAGPVRAELARRGVHLAQMELDWKATTKYMSTLNGSQQVRLRQAVSSASEMADKVDDIYKQYHDAVGDAGMKAFNKAGLIAAQNLPGKAGALAHALVSQISDLTADLGNVYMGGNSPTDHALELAGKNLSADWNRETFEEGIKQVHANIKIRQNSITHAQPAGLSGDSNYFKPDQGGANPTSAPAAQAETRTYQGHTYAKQPDGTWKMQ